MDFCKKRACFKMGILYFSTKWSEKYFKKKNKIEQGIENDYWIKVVL